MLGIYVIMRLSPRAPLSRSLLWPSTRTPWSTNGYHEARILPMAPLILTLFPKAIFPEQME